MPTYDYCCEECFETFETQASMSRYEAYLKDHKPRCPKCGSERTARVITPVNIASSRPDRASRAGGCCPGGQCV